MKKLIYYSAFLLAATLAGCSNELAEPVMNPDYLEPGTSAMQVTISFPQPKSYADEVLTPGTTFEKKITSLAFFVKASHAFGKFYSDEQLLSPNGFTKELTENPDGSYTAAFKMRSTKFEGNSEVIAIANYKENGLDFSEVTTIKKLKESITEAMADGAKNLDTPLLMYGAMEVELKNQETAQPVTLVLERMVARLDVVNKAIDLTDKDDNFVLTGVRLLNVPKSTALLPGRGQTFDGVNMEMRLLGANLTDDIEFNDDDDADATADADDGTIETSMRHLYLYETPNDNTKVPGSQPRIEVQGTYRGATVLREIPFKIADRVGIPGELFPILRNHLYTLTINKSATTGDLDFGIVVKDWAEGDNIAVRPSNKAPKLEGYVFSDGGVTGATWDGDKRTLTLTQPLTGEQTVSLKFKASAYHAPKCVIETPAGSGTFLKLGEGGNVTMGNLIGYADDDDATMPLSRDITITLTDAINEGLTPDINHTNLLKVQTTSTFATTVTVVYKAPAPPVEP